MRAQILLCIVFSSPLFAIPPPVPSAGVIEREIEQEYEGKPLELDKEMPSVEVDIPEEKLLMSSGEKVFVRSIEVEGNEAVSCDEIKQWIKEFLDLELTIVDIYRICKKIDQNYAAKGYFLSRSYPPPQEIHDGVLTIKILEGKIGGIRIEGNKYYSTQFIGRYFEPFCHQALKYDQFLKALLLLNENSDLSAGVLFERGKEVGTADLIVRVSDARPIHLYLNENNYGRKLTTNSQFGGRFDWGNCAFDGDTFSVAEVVGFPLEALYFTDVTYTVPLNTKGTSMEFSYLFSRFHVEELRPLHLKGQSVIATIKATQAMKRTKTLGIDLFSYFDYKQIQNFVLGDRTSFDRLRVLTVGATLDHYNSSRGRDYLNIRTGVGIPSFLGGMAPVSNQSSRTGGGGRFVLMNLDYDRIQQIYKEWMLYFHTSGQWSPNKLTVPEQIYIGGSNTVRGYPLSAALGDSGYYVNVETRFPLPILLETPFFWTKKKWKEALQIVAFLDTGGTIFNGGSSTCITGTGMGLRVVGPYTISLSFDIGFPLNHHKLSSGAFSYLKLTAQPF
ncbi:MAG: ShlB/FhaC/HecB family hemolysin secretion/activation protein [Anaplasmataceae bacterium]|nr:ShlB/FhaC/HecB family hemolysin secretion/activation protein [Anaplasmataceae bacterium]